MKTGSYVKVLFLYTFDDGVNLWAFADGRYHRFLYLAGIYRYVRSQAYLPEGVSGTCYGLTLQAYLNLQGQAEEHGLQLNFYPDLLSCQQGELLEDHPTFIFGLTKPAGQIPQGDPIDRSGNETQGKE